MITMQDRNDALDVFLKNPKLTIPQIVAQKRVVQRAKEMQAQAQAKMMASLIIKGLKKCAL